MILSSEVWQQLKHLGITLITFIIYIQIHIMESDLCI